MLSHVLLAAMSGIALVNAQTPTTTVVAPPTPSSTNGIPTIEGALVYDGPPVQGYTGPGGNATVQSNNTAATYTATFPAFSFDNATGINIMGTVTGTATTNGTGVMFMVNLTGLPDPAMYGPLVYHIHQYAVPADGNCTGTVAHLDPTMRGELHACENTAPQTCQAGDLAGKHGNLTTAGSFSVSYSDLYLSTVSGSPYFFGDKSVVIHSSNATRLTCANFTMVAATTASPSASASPSTVMTSAAGYMTGGNAAAVVAAVAAFLVAGFL